MKTKVRIITLFILICLTNKQAKAQLDLGDLKFDYKNVAVPSYPIIRKFEKKDKFYSSINNSFKYNYPAEIENASGGVSYMGTFSATFTKQPAEAEFGTTNNFQGLLSYKTAKDETITGADGTKTYIRNYSLVYPVTMTIVYNGKAYKTIDFFTAESPLNFRFTKELADPAVTVSGTPFASVQEIMNYEASGKLDKAAEKFAYFEALKKTDEICKNYVGGYYYDFAIGPVVVKKKKSSEYADMNQAADILEEGIKAYKKNDLHTRDSLIQTALQKLDLLNNSAEQRINPIAREVINYNMLVCYAVLENVSKADEFFSKHMSSKVQAAERNTGSYISVFINWLKTREKFKSNDIIHL
jgi:hypothetical protein